MIQYKCTECGLMLKQGHACACGCDMAEPVEQPEPDEIRELRRQAGLSQTAAATLIHSTLRTWQDWEAGKAKMHAGLWELFLLKTAIHIKEV